MGATGALELTFSDGVSNSLDGEGQVTETGTLIAGASVVSIDGEMMFDDCSVAGTWENAQVGSGTWSAVLQ